MPCTRFCTNREALSVDRPTMKIEGSHIGRWGGAARHDGWMMGGWMDGLRLNNNC